MEHIKNQLNVSLNKKGLKKIAEASYICYLFENNKTKILGATIDCSAVSFKGGALKIKAPDSMSASEVRLRGDNIKKELNKIIGQKKVLKIDART